MTASPPPSLRRLAGVLLALAVVPALAFAAAQLFVQSESEAQLARLRDEQLDGLLFSVNQNAWDVVTAWADRLARLSADAPPPGPPQPPRLGIASDTRDFFSATPAAWALVVADTSLSRTTLYQPGDGLSADRADAFTSAIGVERVRSLLEQWRAGYRRLEPIAVGGQLGLVFVAEDGVLSGAPRVMCLIVDPEAFVGMAVMPKLREVALGGVELGVFRAGALVMGTAPLRHADVERERPLWLLPEHTVGARVGEGSAEALMRRRLAQSLLLLGGVTLVLGAGAWTAWRGVRREVEVARLREGFVSNVSHELRTPLALIRLYAEALALGRVAEGQRQRYYDTLVAEAERLSRLVSNVLAFSRAERGEARLDRRPLAIGALVAEVTDRYRPVVEREGGTLTADVAPGLPPVWADRDALAEALVNLVDNAVKYGGPGPVEVGAAPHAAGVALTVSDRGPGLAAADRERVFEPFVRVQPASADGLAHTAKGTGLGLALVRRVALGHGGTAEALPRAGGGATFQITLPAADHG